MRRLLNIFTVDITFKLAENVPESNPHLAHTSKVIEFKVFLQCSHCNVMIACRTAIGKCPGDVYPVGPGVICAMIHGDRRVEAAEELLSQRSHSFAKTLKSL